MNRLYLLCFVFLLSVLCISPASAGKCPLSDDVAEEWLEAAVVDSFSFGFNDYKEVAGKAGELYFSRNGKLYYKSVYDPLGLALQEKMLIQQFAVLKKPVLSEDGSYLVSGIITWSGITPVVDTKSVIFKIKIRKKSGTSPIACRFAIDLIEAVSKG